MINSRGFAVSVPGNGHIRYETPCRDASAVRLSPRPCLIVCDGRGSAKYSHLGAQAAVKAFLTQCAVMEEELEQILDVNRHENQEQDWNRFCRMMVRTVCRQKIELAEAHQVDEAEFDFTIAFAVVGKEKIGTFQVGDGAIVLESDKHCATLQKPDRGEFANQTQFLRADEAKPGILCQAYKINGIAITSDGPEYLMFDIAEMKPGKIFESLFNDLYAGNLTRQQLLDYLTGWRWSNDPRGADDRSLAILQILKDPVENADHEVDLTEFTPEIWAHLSSETLGMYLSKDPELYRKFGEFMKMDGYAWSAVLESFPEFVEACHDWEKFTSWQWMAVLCKQPQLAKYVPDWSIFIDYQWLFMLLNQPELHEYCPILIDPKAAAIAHPEIRDFAELNKSNWPRILAMLPRKSKSPRMEAKEQK